MEEGYQILEHPADVGIEGRGRSLADAFRFAALGMMSLIVEPASVEALEKRTISVRGTDVENLLVRWLSEILFLYDGEDFLVATIDIHAISATTLHATLSGERVNQGKHRFRSDVKAVTYHQVRVEETRAGCLARVFLDT